MLKKKKEKANASPKQDVDDSANKCNLFKGTGVTYDARMSKYDCPWDEHYPENSSRFTRCIEKCKEYGLLDRVTYIPSRFATEEELLLQHTVEHLAFMKCTSLIQNLETLEELSSRFDSVRFVPNLYDAALLSVGCTIELVDAILSNEVTNGMAVIRPPGHHAMTGEVCGYSYFNNVAIAAKHAILNRSLQRVLIVDWDLHHGHGTQQMFYDDPRVLYFSIHRYEHGEFWPNLRISDSDHVGDGDGSGYNINVPLNKIGMGNADYMAIFHQLLLPVAFEFDPQLVLISCGFDSSLGDSEGCMELTPPFYAHMTSSLMGLANGKVCAVLEGGYFLSSLSEGVAMTIRTLLGDPCPEIGALHEPDISIVDTINDVVHHHQRFWKCLSRQKSSSARCTVEFRGVDHRPSRFETRQVPECTREDADEFELRIQSIMKEVRLTFPANRTCLVFDVRMTNHCNYVDKSHPEKPDRIKRIYDLHKENGLLKRCLQLPARHVTDSELQLIHSKRHVEFMRTTMNVKPRDLNKMGDDFKSVYLCQNTNEAAQLAAGCLLQVVDHVLSNQSRNGVAIIRPPGHHAEVDKPMGFCIYNNVALAAKHSIVNRDLSRVLVVDWDVHHGNGTQNAFLDDPRVLYVSVHRYDNGLFFPSSIDGNFDVVGIGRGEGFNVNVPWNKGGMGDVEYFAVFTDIILPIAYEYDPELVLVSAGFDAAAGDPLGGCKVSPAGFARMTHLLSSLAGGKIVLALEGGYNLSSISQSMVSCTKALLGDCPFTSYTSQHSMYEENNLVPCTSAIKSVNNVKRVQSKYWSRISFDADMSNESSDRVASSSSSPITSSSNVSTSSVDSTEPVSSPENYERQPQPIKTYDEDELCQNVSAMSVSDRAAEGAVGGVNPTSSMTAKEYESPTTYDDASCDSMSGYIVPLSWCPHLEHHVRPVPSFDDRMTGDFIELCKPCGDRAENWFCLFCHKVYCSRYVNRHMVEHWRRTDHVMAVSFSDLSAWCYGCESYVHHKSLIPIKSLIHEKKFGISMPNKN